MIKRLLILFLLCVSFSANAAVVDKSQFSKYFEIDLDEELPSLKELEEKYIPEKSKLYDKRYDYHWNIGNNFDKIFRMTINRYGGSDKRLKHEYEEDIMKMLKALPPETYEYVGPLLHVTPNMPEKILNMPGIKETKNKFPSRIAPQLQHIENLEFLSPHLYMLLMPEIWPGYVSTAETETVKKVVPRVEHNQVFFEKIKKMVPIDEYISDEDIRVYNSELRTLKVTKDSPITSADVKAFVNTLDKVQEFGNQPGYMYNFTRATILLDMYDKDSGAPVSVTTLKDMVNPCKRLAQKIRLLGLEDEFQIVIGEDGFDLNSWAYTCDKTVNAYRMATIKTPLVTAIKSYKQGLYDHYQDFMSSEDAKNQFVVMQGVVDMYSAPMNNISEVRKNRDVLAEKFRNMNFAIIDAPITIMY